MLNLSILTDNTTSFDREKKLQFAVVFLSAVMAVYFWGQPHLTPGSWLSWAIVVCVAFLVDPILYFLKVPVFNSKYYSALTLALYGGSMAAGLWILDFTGYSSTPPVLNTLYLALPLFALTLLADLFGFYLLFLIYLHGPLAAYWIMHGMSQTNWDLLGLIGFDLILIELARKQARKSFELKKVQDECQVRQTFLLEAANASEKGNEAKSRFVVDMNRELRTRLEVIMNYAQMIIMSKVDKAQGKRAQVVVQAGKQLLKLSDQMRDVNNIEQGNLKLDMKEVRLVDHLAKSVSLVTPYATQMGMRIDEDYKNIPEVMVYVDPARLNQVLLNLLTNAIKFNRPRGKIQIIASLKDDKTVLIEVKDNGIGIPQEKVAYIFEAFTRIERKDVKGRGAGLGLHMAKAFLEAMGGNIWVKSVPNYGSIFNVELSISQMTSSQVEMNNAVLVNQNILIVDDSKVKRIVLARQIQNIGGYQINQVSNGKEALDLLGQKDYQLVLTDYMMPEIDGIELCQKIRDFKSKEELPVLVVTADTTESTQQGFDKAGANELVTYPVDSENLRHLLGKYVNQPALKRIEQKRKNQGSELYQQIKKHLVETFGDNKDAMENLFQSFIKEVGAQKKEMLAAQKSKDVARLKKTIAKIKWASKSIGAYQLVQVCTKLENFGNEVDWKQLQKPLAYIARYHKVLEMEFNATSGNFAVPVPDLEELKFLNNMSVMLLDDDYFLLNYVKQILDNFGVKNIAVFSDGNEALEALNNKDGQGYDLIFSDLNMPNIDGIAFFRELSKIGFENRLILMSGLSEEVRQSAVKLSRSFGLNVVGTLGKPIQSEELHSMLLKTNPEFDKSKNKKVEESFSSQEMLESIQKGEFIPFYHPKIDAESKQIYGFEALVRWKKGRKILPPGAFLVQLEKHNLMKPLTESLIEQVLVDTQSWKKQGHDFKVAINITVDLLEDVPFIDDLIQKVKDSNIPKKAIVVEVTESSLIADYYGALEGATRIRMAGFGLSIDDFGTGSATFEQLNKIPFTELKIDQAFVTNAHSDQAKQTVLESSLEIAKRLKLNVVAEGIETQEDYDLLYFLGCGYLQGYYFTQPLDKKKTDAWIKLWNKKNPKKG